MWWRQPLTTKRQGGVEACVDYPASRRLLVGSWEPHMGRCVRCRVQSVMTWQDGDPSSSGMRLFVALVVVCPIFQFFIFKSFFWARSNSINSRSSFIAFYFNLFLFPSHHLRWFVFNISNQTWLWWTRTDCLCLAFSLTFWAYVGLPMAKIKFSVFVLTKNQDENRVVSIFISHMIMSIMTVFPSS